MTRDEKIVKACRLKEKGVRVTDIAHSMGTPAATVAGWVRDVPWPEKECYVCGATFQPNHGNQKVCCGENARKRFHEREIARENCSECGSLLGQGSGHPGRNKTGLCFTCWGLSEAERIDPIARKVESLWSSEAPLKEIAAEMGWSRNYLTAQMHRLREKGYHLPYRSRFHKHAPVFPDQVPA